MSNVDLYNTSYGNSAVEAYRQVRLETYGEDFGQTSWTTSEEYREIARMLELHRESNVLEIACGAGGCAVYFAETTGCRVAGLDVNREGIAAANALAESKNLRDRTTFREHDVSKGIPYESEAFDAIFSNDAFCHFADRLALLRECLRVLRVGGRLFFSDALVITGMVTNEEIATRSSIGHYVFMPPGENERLLAKSGLKLLHSDDATAAAAAIAKRWCDARAHRKAILAPIEGEANFEGLQRFLQCVHTLSAEKRLSRCLYLAAKA